jgi:hypothetical protein
MTAKKDTPAIVTVKCLPYLVSDLEHFQNSQGEMLPTHRVIALCRCGHSEDKDSLEIRTPIVFRTSSTPMKGTNWRF